ncbi:MAG: hypothetical protein AB1427_21110 [Thermodesulfobacteriota bacterium]
MPIKIWIEKDQKRVRVVVTGTFSTDDIFQAIDRIRDDPDFESGFAILSDHTGIDTAITPTQAQSTAAHIEQLSRHFAGAKWAVVTQKDASYGMMRMLSVYLETVPVYLQVFRSFEEAEDWLAGPWRNRFPG